MTGAHDKPAAVAVVERQPSQGFLSGLLGRFFR
jgi:hypothetical protein